MSRSPEQLEAYLRRTTAALLEAEAQLERERAERREPIAIIGIGCRLPGGVDGPAAFWDLLAAGRDAIGPLPERWAHLELFDPDPDAPGKCYAREGGFLDGVDRFDAAFFGVAPREAEWMDPQQRLALEVAWHALEDAGVRPSSLSGTRTGVFLGTMGSDYALAARGALETLTGYQSTGNASSVLSGRLSYQLGLHGPALTVDTACSSSLVTLHLACESLRRGESEVALAGGVTVMCEPAALVEFSRLRGLSPGGRCRSFAAGADGMGWAEGGGVVVLKRLSSARRDGDRVRAVLRGSAVNQDGRSQGLTAPSGPAQQRVIGDALRACRLSIDDLDAIEAHGTGTRLGDPIEAGALAHVLAARTAPEPVYLGSVKSNLGHTQAAAGVVGVIKMVLALEYERLPATLHAAEPTPLVEWAGSRLELLQQARPWPRTDRVRRAGISAFGISGTNAHVVIEEAPAPDAPGAPVAAEGPALPVVLSATDPAALARQAERLAAWIEARPVRLADVAYTRAVARDALAFRVALAARDVRELADALRALATGGADAVEPALAAPEVCALFTGQGSQRAAMGRALHARFPRFRAAFDEVCRAAEPHLAVRLRDAVLAAAGDLDATELAQPALFAIEVALARLWQAWGVQPALVLGHSVGELAAAHVAGVLELEDAARLVCARGRLMQRCRAGGAMASIEAGAEAAASMLAAYDGRLWLAADNGPRQVVASGDADAIEALLARLAASGTRARRLRVSHAFHSHHMDDALAAFGEVAARCTFRAPAIRLASTLDGAIHDASTPAGRGVRGADYWVRQLREPVRLRAAVAAAAAAGARVLLELGPSDVLAGMAAACAPRAAGVRAIASLGRGDDEPAELAAALGRVHAAGVELAWKRVFEGSGVRRIELPPYAFARERHWHAGPPARAGAAGDDAAEEDLFRLQLDAAPDAAPQAAPGGATWWIGRAAPSAPGPGERAFATLDDAPASGEAPARVVVDLTGAAADGVAALLPRFAELRALLGRPELAGAELAFVTRGAVPLAERRASAPGQAALWGLVRAARSEHPSHRIRLIDLDADGDRDRAVRAALAQGGPEVAVTGETPRALRLIAAAPPAGAPPSLAGDGAILVTGGTGDLGRTICLHLARGHGARRFVITSRRGPAAGGAAELAGALAALGAEARIVRCDAADRDQLAAVLAGEPRWAAVLHLAGVLDDALLANLSEAQIERVLRPKLAGARNLDELTAGQPLRAFVLFSSIAGVLGGLGQSAYAAANCYLDGLAHARRLRGEVATSIAWGLWRPGAGMAAGLSETALDRLRAEGVGALDPGDACRLLDRALASPEPVVVAARFVRAALQRKADRGGAVPPLLHGLLARPPGHAGPSRRPAWRRELLRAGGPEEQLAAIRKRVLAEAAAVFGAASLPARDAERPLRELGLTSLMALQLRDRLAAAAGVELAATLAFDHPTCASIAGHLRDALGLAAETAAAAAATAADHMTPLEIDAELDAVLGPPPPIHPSPAAARALPEEHRS